MFKGITTFAHWIASARRTMSHVLWSQHNSGLIFWTHVFTSTQQCSIILIICRRKDCKLILDGIISIVPHPFVLMHPSHSYFWSGSSGLDWCKGCFTTNLMSQALSWFLVKFNEFYSGRWFPIVNIAYYFIAWNQAKSTGIQRGVHPRS